MRYQWARLSSQVVSRLPVLRREPRANDAREFRAILDGAVARRAAEIGQEATDLELESLALFDMERLLQDTAPMPRRWSVALMLHVARARWAAWVRGARYIE